MSPAPPTGEHRTGQHHADDVPVAVLHVTGAPHWRTQDRSAPDNTGNCTMSHEYDEYDGLRGGDDVDRHKDEMSFCYYVMSLSFGRDGEFRHKETV